MRAFPRGTAIALLTTVVTCSAVTAAVLPAAATTTTTLTSLSATAERVTVGAVSFTVAGVNVPRGADDLVVYTRTSMQTSTPTSRWGAEVTVVGGKVTAVSDRERTGAGPTAIPSGGIVLSGHGQARAWLLQYAKVGTTGLIVPGDVTTVTVGPASYPLTGIDVARPADGLVVYTRTSSQSVTPTNQWGVEVVVTGGKVSGIFDRQRTAAGPTNIPAGSLVLSGHGAARDWLLAQARLGTSVLAPAVAPSPAPTPATSTAAPTVLLASPEPVSASPLPTPPPVVAPAPQPASLLTETFSGSDGTFSDQNAFWGSQDLGISQNSTWFTESGSVQRRLEAGYTSSPVMRMWTRRTDLAFTNVAMDVRFNRFTGGSEGWHGINLWLNETLCTPAPGCTKVQDGPSAGPSGYAVDFMNRDGKLTILKKVHGDTRAKWPGASSYANGGTYYQLAGTRWTPQPGVKYRFAGRVIDSGNGTATLQILIDGQVKLQVVDTGRVGGPRLTGGRVGLRSDYADYTVDNILVTR